MVLGDGDTPDLRVAETHLELTVATGPVQGLSGLVAPPSRLIVGRAPNCQLRVVDPRMSREHFVTRYFQGRWWIEDLASSNGTLVNGQRIVAATQLRFGDVVQAGDTRFRVSVSAITPSRTKVVPPVTVRPRSHHHASRVQAAETD